MVFSSNYFHRHLLMINAEIMPYSSGQICQTNQVTGHLRNVWIEKKRGIDEKWTRLDANATFPVNRSKFQSLTNAYESNVLRSVHKHAFVKYSEPFTFNHSTCWPVLMVVVACVCVYFSIGCHHARNIIIKWATERRANEHNQKSRHTRDWVRRSNRDYARGNRTPP